MVNGKDNVSVRDTDRGSALPPPDYPNWARWLCESDNGERVVGIMTTNESGVALVYKGCAPAQVAEKREEARPAEIFFVFSDEKKAEIVHRFYTPSAGSESTTVNDETPAPEDLKEVKLPAELFVFGARGKEVEGFFDLVEARHPRANLRVMCRGIDREWLKSLLAGKFIVDPPEEEESAQT